MSLSPPACRTTRSGSRSRGGARRTQQCAGRSTSHAGKSCCIVCYVSSEGESPMSTEANKVVVRRFFDQAINQRKLDVLDEILAPDFEGNKLEIEQRSNTRAELKKMLEMVF